MQRSHDGVRILSRNVMRRPDQDGCSTASPRLEHQVRVSKCVYGADNGGAELRPGKDTDALGWQQRKDAIHRVGDERLLAAEGKDLLWTRGCRNGPESGADATREDDGPEIRLSR